MGEIRLYLPSGKYSAVGGKVAAARQPVTAVKILRFLQQPRARSGGGQWLDVAGRVDFGSAAKSAAIDDRGLSRVGQLRGRLRRDRWAQAGLAHRGGLDRMAYQTVGLDGSGSNVPFSPWRVESVGL